MARYFATICNGSEVGWVELNGFESTVQFWKVSDELAEDAVKHADIELLFATKPPHSRIAAMASVEEGRLVVSISPQAPPVIHELLDRRGKRCPA